MDANGTRFHLLLGREDWARCRPAPEPFRLVDGTAGIRPAAHFAQHETLGEAWDAEAGGAASPGGPESRATLEYNLARQELRLRSAVFRFRQGQQNPVHIESRRGAACDRYGNVYWISEDRRSVRVASTGCGGTSTFWPPEPPDPPDDSQAASGRFGRCPESVAQPPAAPPVLSGLAVTEDHYLLVGTSEPPGLFAFDLHAGGPPRRFYWPESAEDRAAAPPLYHLATARGGGAWVLDYRHRRLARLDRHLDLVLLRPNALGADTSPPGEWSGCEFFPVDGRRNAVEDRRGRVAGRAGVSIACWLPLDSLASPAGTPRDPRAIDVLSDGTVLILDAAAGAASRVWALSPVGEPLGVLSTGELLHVIADSDEAGFQFPAHDLVFVADREPGGVLGIVFMVGADGNQAFAFELRRRAADVPFEWSALPRHYPMRLFGGRALVRCGRDVLFDTSGPSAADPRWVPLVEQRRPRFESAANLVTPPFDGRSPDCVWHRLFIDACIPPGTKVEVWSRAANEKAGLERLAWSSEPAPYRRRDGSEQPFVRGGGGDRFTGSSASSPPTIGCGCGSDGGGGGAAPSMTLAAPLGMTAAGAEAFGVWELLFQGATGRFLQVRLRLSGGGASTPRLRAARFYYPRPSYPERYLPAVYREEPGPASFLERFLANLEGFYTATEDRITASRALFDPRAAPAEALEWLAGWVSLTLDPALDERRRRLLIRHAAEFYRWRGTPRGLVVALRLVLDPCADDRLFTELLQRTDGGRGSHRFGIRVVESFLTRPAGSRGQRADLSPGREMPGRAKSTAAGQAVRWTPMLGPDALHRRFADALRRREDRSDKAGEEQEEEVRFPLTQPGDAAGGAAWTAFAQQELGFVPRHAAADLPRWQAFLARKYRRIAALNDAYGTSHRAMEEVKFPTALPRRAAALGDWYVFQSVILPVAAAAHRFTVLLPLPRGGDLATTSAAGADAFYARQDERRRLAERVVRAQKPAHTVFDTRFYWAMFRVGEARLGLDTVLDVGSRAPELLPPVVLDRAYLAQGRLEGRPPHDQPGRNVLGRCRYPRDRLPGVRATKRAAPAAATQA